MANDYYAVLGVPQNATEKQIRTRFLELARERHPDRFHGDEKTRAEAEFQEITQAFNILTDRERRRQLDIELKRPSLAQQGSSQEAAKVYIARGLEALKANQLQRAIDLLERATKEAPENARAWFQLGLACQKRPGGKARGRVALAKACELEPMNATYLKEAARAFDSGGMYADAARLYKEALDWGGEDEELRAAFQTALKLAKSVG